MTRGIWAKEGAKVSTPRTKKTPTRITIQDWIPEDVLIWESQFPDQIMNARRQTLFNLKTGQTPVKYSGASVQEQIKDLGRSFFGDCLTIADWEDSGDWTKANTPA